MRFVIVVCVFLSGCKSTLDVRGKSWFSNSSHRPDVPRSGERSYLG
jgi:hypothetical protein